MKRILFVLLFVPAVFFGQDYNIGVSNENVKRFEMEKSNQIGIKLIGNGVYTIGVKGGDLGGRKQQIRRAEKSIKQFAENQNKKYKILSTETTKVEGILDSPKPFALVTFQIINQDGTLFISKEDAKKQLIELKEYLDLGIITQEEYDERAASLKKILLGN